MADLLNIRIDGDKALVEGKLFDSATARHFLKEALDDIADAIEVQVDRTVPVGDTGELKAHPLERDESGVGVVDPRAFSIGGGVTARGAGGRFVKGGLPASLGGDLVGRVTITLPTVPKHAIWVHEGTGIYKPGGSGKPIQTKPPGKYMTFFWSKGVYTKNFRLKTVKGQAAQPYLTEAYLLIQGTYVPHRIQLLRAQIDAAT